MQERGLKVEFKTKQTPEIIEHFLTELKNPFPSLTLWEENFIISITDQFNRKRTLSPKQFEILERIYAEKTA